MTASNSKVRFHPSVQVVEILNISDYKPSEKAAAWFSQEEMDKITKRCFKVINSVDTGRNRKYCIRGLEGHLKLGSISKKKSRSTALTSVLNEQLEQWIEGIVDEQAIADVYQRTTSSCQLWAQVKGQKDRQTADIILYQEDGEEDCAHHDEAQNSPTPSVEKERTVHKSKECTISSPSASSKSSLRLPRQASKAVKCLSSQGTRTARLVAAS